MYQVPRANCAMHPGSGCIQTLKITRQHDTRSRYQDCETRCCPESKVRLTQDGRDFHVGFASIRSIRWGVIFPSHTARFLFDNDTLLAYEIVWPNMRNNLSVVTIRHIPVMKRWKNRKKCLKNVFKGERRSFPRRLNCS